VLQFCVRRVSVAALEFDPASLPDVVPENDLPGDSQQVALDGGDDELDPQRFEESGVGRPDPIVAGLR
jgi:hypothetical protein